MCVVTKMRGDINRKRRACVISTVYTGKRLGLFMYGVEFVYVLLLLAVSVLLVFMFVCIYSIKLQRKGPVF